MFKSNLVFKASVLVLILAMPNLSHAKHKSQGGHTKAAARGGPYAGQRCSRGDRDATKCAMCVAMFEGGKSQADRIAVVQVLLKRAHGHPGEVCREAHAAGQFVALNRNPTIRGGSGDVHQAVQEAFRRGPGKYAGFRSYCRPGKGDKKIAGGNCYRVKAELEDGVVLNPGGVESQFAWFEKEEDAQRLTGPDVQFADAPQVYDLQGASATN